MAGKRQAARCVGASAASGAYHRESGGEEQTIKVASKKNAKTGPIKLKKQAPKHKQPGNWMDGSIVDGMRPLQARRDGNDAR